MNVVATKNRYLNIKGEKKIKLLTSGKIYRVRDIRNWNGRKDFLIIDDTNRILFYKENYFHSILMNRDRILSNLGI